MSYDQRRQQALDSLAAGDPTEAFAAFRDVLEYPDELDDQRWPDALMILAQIAAPIAGDQLATALQMASDNAGDPDRLYDAAYQLYEQGLHGIAASLLARANELAPGQPGIVTELSSNLEALIRYDGAAQVVRASGLADSDPMCRYLLAFNSIMSGELEEPRTLLPALMDVDDDDVQFMANAIRGMLARADAIAAVTPLDDADLSGWHVVVNGGVLLHESPHGFDEGMHGRYAYVADNYGLMKEGLQNARDVLDAVQTSVPRVIACPDRDSTILATAAAALLDAELVPWQPGDVRPGLVVAYDMDRIGDSDVLNDLKNHRPGQFLFAHANCWTDPFPYAPDLSTFQYQSCTNTWAGGAMHVDPATQQVTAEPPDNADAADIATRITAAQITDPSHRALADVKAMVTAVASLPEDVATGLFRNTGPRWRQRNGSPVMSNRFR